MAAHIDIEMPVVVKRVAEQIERGFRSFAPAESVAGVIVSTGDIAAGLAALPVLEQLRARHVKRVWGGQGSFPMQLRSDRMPRPDDVVAVCTACNVAWPCADAEILGVA